MAKIAREKNAHKECPEFGQVQRDLAEYERKALTRFRDDYDLKVEAENKVYAGEIHLIETRANVGFPFSIFPFLGVSFEEGKNGTLIVIIGTTREYPG
jgi:hypothetical protein